VCVRRTCRRVCVSFCVHSDVWSFAVALWELATGMKPYHDLNAAQVRSTIWNAVRDRVCVQAAVAIARGVRLPRPDGMQDDLWTLLNDCWAVDAAARPSVSEIMRRLAAMLADDVRAK
jgi:hypothetical protein